MPASEPASIAMVDIRQPESPYGLSGLLFEVVWNGLRLKAAMTQGVRQKRCQFFG
jgi:hypothetical protein